jgi:hypothetical protein
MQEKDRKHSKSMTRKEQSWTTEEKQCWFVEEIRRDEGKRKEGRGVT